MNWLEWLRLTFDIEKPSDALMYVGFSIVFLTFIGWWVTILAQMFNTNPALGVFMLAISVGFAFIFSGLFLHQKGS